MQQYADIYLLLNYCTYFWHPSRPSSGVHTTVVAASGMYRSYYLGASFLKRDQIRTPYLVTFEEACSRIVQSVPEAATTVLCTPDDGRDRGPKHVE